MAEEGSQEQVIVFEAVNETLKEFYVGISNLPLTADEIASRHREAPPAAIAHWKKEHQVWYRCVDAGLTASGSQDFIRSYSEKMARPDWKALAVDGGLPPAKVPASPTPAPRSGLQIPAWDPPARPN